MVLRLFLIMLTTFLSSNSLPVFCLSHIDFTLFVYTVNAVDIILRDEKQCSTYIHIKSTQVEKTMTSNSDCTLYASCGTGDNMSCYMRIT